MIIKRVTTDKDDSLENTFPFPLTLIKRWSNIENPVLKFPQTLGFNAKQNTSLSFHDSMQSRFQKERQRLKKRQEKNSTEAND